MDGPNTPQLLGSVCLPIVLSQSALDKCLLFVYYTCRLSGGRSNVRVYDACDTISVPSILEASILKGVASSILDGNTSRKSELVGPVSDVLVEISGY